MDESKRLPGIDNAADKVRGAADRVASSATSTIDAARSSVRDAVDRLSDRANSAADWATDAYDSATDTPARLAGAGASVIRGNPYMAVGLALAIGWLVGRVSR